jgi:membrane protease YdiL (CAAX protease family)
VAAGSRRTALPAGGSVALAGYLAGRALFEQSSAWLAGRGAGAGLATILPLPAYVAVVLAGVWAAVRIAGAAADPGPALRLSPRVARASAAAGLLALLLVTVVYAAAVLGGWATAERAAPGARLASTLTAYAVLYAAVAWNEEVVFRGAVLGVLGRWGGPRLGIAGSSALFALVHLGTSATWTRLLGVFLLGVLLALVRLSAGSLWPSIALHWTFHVLSYAAVLGLPPLRLALTGPVALTGTADQLDAGALMILALAVAAGSRLLSRPSARRPARAMPGGPPTHRLR